MKNKIIYPFYLILAIVFISHQAEAQSGSFINVFGAGQQTWMLNTDDYYINGGGPDNTSTDKLFFEDSYHPAFGIEYINNFEGRFGWQTGIIFSTQGQGYRSAVDTITDTFSHNHGISYFKESKSIVALNYLKVPFAIRFNGSMEEEDRYTVSIYAGLELSYLLNVNTVTNEERQYQTHDAYIPAPIMVNGKPFPTHSYKKFFNPLDFGVVLGSSINIFLNRPKTWGFDVGFNYERGFVNVENHKYPYRDHPEYPASLYFPVTVNRTITPSQEDVGKRSPSKNIAFRIYAGLFFKLKSGPPPPAIREDLPEGGGQ